MKNWIIQHKLYLIGAFVGGIAGYLYWQQVGCSSGTCAITSKPFNSTVYFAFMGALVFGMFHKEQNQKETPESADKP